MIFKNEWMNEYFLHKMQITVKGIFLVYNSIVKNIQVFYVIVFWLRLSISKTANVLEFIGYIIVRFLPLVIDHNPGYKS